jgi:hypothetical protein
MQAQDLGQFGKQLIRHVMVSSMNSSRKTDIAIRRETMVESVSKRYDVSKMHREDVLAQTIGRDRRQITLSGLGSPFGGTMSFGVCTCATRQACECTVAASHF